MKINHSPAPWHYHRRDINTYAVTMPDGCEFLSDQHPNSEANAKLIIAAPELLDALGRINGLIQKSILTANEKEKNAFLREAIVLHDEVIKKSTEYR